MFKGNSRWLIICSTELINAVFIGDICVSGVNAVFMCLVIDDTTKEIVYRDYVDISVAVATPKVRQMHYIVMQTVKCFIAHLSFNVKS